MRYFVDDDILVRHAKVIKKITGVLESQKTEEE